MPRNPRKTRCQIPGCRSWAMRGHSLCRSHRDAELDPRGGGAPPHNLNALKTGAHAHPLPPLDLDQLAKNLVRDPDHLPDHLAAALQSIHDRTHDPYKTLVALHKALPELLNLVVTHLYAAEVRAIVRQLPPSQRAACRPAMEKQTRDLFSQDSRAGVMQWVIESQKRREKQVPVQ